MLVFFHLDEQTSRRDNISASQVTGQTFTPRGHLMDSASLQSALRESLTFQNGVSVAVSKPISYNCVELKMLSTLLIVGA